MRRTHKLLYFDLIFLAFYRRCSSSRNGFVILNLHKSYNTLFMTSHVNIVKRPPQMMID